MMAQKAAKSTPNNDSIFVYYTRSYEVKLSGQEGLDNGVKPNSTKFRPRKRPR